MEAKRKEIKNSFSLLSGEKGAEMRLTAIALGSELKADAEKGASRQAVLKFGAIGR